MRRLCLLVLVLSLLFPPAALGEKTLDPFRFMNIPYDTGVDDYEDLVDFLYDTTNLRFQPDGMDICYTLADDQAVTFAGQDVNITLTFYEPNHLDGASLYLYFNRPYGFQFETKPRAYSEDVFDDELEEHERPVFNLPDLYPLAHMIDYVSKHYQPPAYAYIECYAFTAETGEAFPAQAFKVSTPITNDTLDAIRRLCYERDFVEFTMVLNNISLTYSFDDEDGKRYCAVYFDDSRPENSQAEKEKVNAYPELPTEKSPYNYFAIEVIDLAAR